MSEFPVTMELWGVADVALQYGLQLAGSVPPPFNPALVTESRGGERGIVQLLLAAGSADPLADARRRLATMPDIVRAAVVLDGSVHIGDGTEDAVIVIVGDAATPAHRFAQRYRRKRFSKRANCVGNLGYMGTEEPILA